MKNQNKIVIPPEYETVKPKKRWTAQKVMTMVLSVLLLLIVATYFSVRYFNPYFSSLFTVQTPLPPAPELPQEVLVDSMDKITQYDQEIKLEKKQERHGNGEDNNWDRIRVNWDSVYSYVHKQKEPEKVPDTVVIVKEKPKEQIKSTRQVHRPARRKPPPSPKKRQLTKQEVKEPRVKKVAFNTTTQKVEAEEKPQPQKKKSIFAEAIIAGDQKIRSGQSIVVQLTNTVRIDTVLIPAQAMVYGICSFGNGRVNISGEHIVVDGQIISINFDCYDQYMVRGLPYEQARAQERLTDRASNRANQGLRSLPDVPIVSDALRDLGQVAREITRSKRGKVNLPHNYAIFLKITL